MCWLISPPPLLFLLRLSFLLPRPGPPTLWICSAALVFITAEDESRPPMLRSCVLFPCVSFLPASVPCSEGAYPSCVSQDSSWDLRVWKCLIFILDWWFGWVLNSWFIFPKEYASLLWGWRRDCRVAAMSRGGDPSAYQLILQSLNLRSHLLPNTSFHVPGSWFSYFQSLSDVLWDRSASFSLVSSSMHPEVSASSVFPLNCWVVLITCLIYFCLFLHVVSCLHLSPFILVGIWVGSEIITCPLP